MFCHNYIVTWENADTFPDHPLILILKIILFLMCYLRGLLVLENQALEQKYWPILSGNTNISVGDETMETNSGTEISANILYIGGTYSSPRLVVSHWIQSLAGFDWLIRACQRHENRSAVKYGFVVESWVQKCSQTQACSRVIHTLSNGFLSDSFSQGCATQH